MLRHFESGNNVQKNWHLHAMAASLEAARLGTSRRQITTMPPRSFKSLMTSVAWTAWLLGHDPATRIIAVSYSESLAEQLSTDTRRVLESLIYQQLFPNTVLTRSTTTQLVTSQGGMRFATSVGGPTTGFGGD